MADDIAESDAERRAALFESIIESMGESVLVVDRDGKQVYANKELRRFRGEVRPQQKNDDWRNPTVMKIFDKDYKELAPHDWPVARALRGDYSDSFEIWVRGMAHREGDTLLSISTRSLADASGQIEGAVIVTRDITAIRQTEEKLRQSQKLETIGQLTGGVAHDFNNMLAAILSSAEVLKKGAVANAKLQQAALTVEKAAIRGAELTRHLLAFARKQTLSPSSVDVDDLVRETLLLLRPALSATIEVIVTSPGPIFALADPAQLTAALLNLCINARDAMSDSGTLTIELAETAIEGDHALKPGEYVCLAVTDTGTGMSAEVLARAVEPFFTTKGVGKGSGLGLSMVYGFVRQSGGDVRIESKEGVGSTISMLLPRSEAAPVEAPAPIPQQPGRLRILVVDDDDLVRDALCMQLRDEGYVAEAATNGKHALALIEQGLNIDLLISDMVMPGGVSGADLVAALRTLRPGVRTILSTGYTDQDLPELRAAPGALVLRKPYSAEQLLATIRAAMLGT